MTTDPQGSERYRYKNPARIARWLKGMLWLLIASTVLAAVAYLNRFAFFAQLQAHAFSSRDVIMAAADSADQFVKIAARTQLVLVLVVITLFLVWVHRMSSNVHAMGARGLRASPGWAVGWFLVPIANIFMPPLVLSQIWKASANATDWKAQRSSWVIGAWWALNLLVSFISLVVAGQSRDAKGIDAFMDLDTVRSFHRILEVVFFFVQIVLVARMTRLQLAQGKKA